MSFSERVQQINQEIGATVERALSDLRQEISRRLRAGHDEILRRLDEVTPELPGSFLADQDLTPLAEQMASAAAAEAGGTARRAAFADLRDAVAVIDRARSQAEILAALLRESSRFSARAAVLLLRGAEVRGWGGQGFGEAEPSIRELAFAAADGNAWGGLPQARAAIRLGAGECAELCGRIEAPLPHEGLLVPLVLRDRVAAGLYADRLEGELAAEALQVLCFVAAQAIELLPFRERPFTPTLNLEGEPSPAAPPAEPEPAPEAAEPEPEPEPEPAWSAPEAPAATEMLEVPAEPEELADEIEIEAEPEPAAWAAAPAEPEPEPVPEEMPEEVETVAEVEALPEALPEELPELPAEPEPVSPAATVYQPLPVEAFRSAQSAAPEPAAATATQEATVLLPRPGLRETPPAPVPLRPVPAPPPAPPPEAASTSAAGLAGSAEVQPPTGVDGPGWAFATSRVAVSPNEEALHEEARRLARLLVSEIKLYNEEQVEEGRRKRDVYERLKEDIDRSRQMYEERVEPRILKTTDYFYQELVRILAAGDAKALGI